MVPTEKVNPGNQLWICETDAPLEMDILISTSAREAM
jgi:hypothetical protein